jgi:predicted ABC-type ATPase
LSRRPVLYVLAGVNGAGKSSIGGRLLTNAGLTWFNPDAFARELIRRTGCSLATANSAAWGDGIRRLDEAVANRWSYAFETTLGGRTVPLKIREAAPTHDVYVWYCGLQSADLHVRRVRARVAAGGHDIPEDKIRERYHTSVTNLIALLPHLTRLQVYDNSDEAATGARVPDPRLVLDWTPGRLNVPPRRDIESLASTPAWATPIVEAALRLG